MTASLREQLDECDETIRQLREQLVPPLTFPARWRLTATEGAVLSFLLARAPHPRSQSQILDALYAEADDVPAAKLVDVLLCKLRKKLAPEGVTIDTRWGEGFALNAESARRVRALSQIEHGAARPDAQSLFIVSHDVVGADRLRIRRDRLGSAPDRYAGCTSRCRTRTMGCAVSDLMRPELATNELGLGGQTSLHGGQIAAAPGFFGPLSQFVSADAGLRGTEHFRLLQIRSFQPGTVTFPAERTREEYHWTGSAAPGIRRFLRRYGATGWPGRAG